MRYLLTILTAFIFVSGICGCHKSGKWVNDPNNWKRAFGNPPPTNFEVIHSIYWRTPHFTREDGWTFQVKSPPSFYKEWLGAYKVKHPDSAELQRLEFLKKDKPAWFLPKPLAEYEIWVIDQPDSNFGLFIDQTSGEWFVTDAG